MKCYVGLGLILMFSAFAIFVMSTVARADAPRQIDFTQVLNNPDGKPMQECADDPAPRSDAECKVRHNVTLGMISMRALAVFEQGLGGEASLKRGQLAMRVYKAKSLVLTTDEITIVKNQIAKMYGPLIVAITFPMLDPAVGK